MAAILGGRGECVGGTILPPTTVTETAPAELRHLRGNVVVVWDGGPNHMGPAVREFLAGNSRLRLERFPAYCPDLNPVESAWSWLKYGQPAYAFLAGVGELDDEVIGRLIDLEFDPGLLKLLWARSGLPPPGKPDEQPCLPAGQ